MPEFSLFEKLISPIYEKYNKKNIFINILYTNLRYTIGHCLTIEKLKMNMRRLWIGLILLVIFSCTEEELSFTPSVESLYLNQFKVWSKTDIIIDPATGEKISESETRDLQLQYIFTSETVSVSNNGGENFFTFPDSYIGLDSISYTDPGSGVRVSYYVLEVFRMKNGDPRFKDYFDPRDEFYPELDGYYLFLHLENKNQPEAEGGRLTEILLMYSEGFASNIQ